MEKLLLNHIFKSHPRSFKDLIMKGKTMKNSKENLEKKYLSDLAIGKDFLNKIQKTQV